MKLDLKRFLRDFPSTNGKIVWTLGLATLVFVRVLASGIVFSIGGVVLSIHALDIAIISALLTYLAAQGGWNYAQFKTKRDTTFRPNGEATGKPEEPEE